LHNPERKSLLAWLGIWLLPIAILIAALMLTSRRAKAQELRQSDLSPRAPHTVVRQGHVVVLRPGDRTCATPLEAFDKRWYCRPDGALILAIPVDAEPGVHVIGHTTHATVAVSVEPVLWPAERRPAPKPRAAPPGRRERDAALRDEAYRAHLSERWTSYRLQVPLWDPLPTDHRVTDPFGFRRFYGKATEPTVHTGADLAAPKSGLWDIRAPDAIAVAAGVVTLAAELWDSGNTVIVYHGDGVYTSYSHLEFVAVAAGGQVSAGAKLGTVGGTVGGGRIGTHLHLVLRINGIPVDPLDGIAALNRALYLNGLPR